MKTRTRLRLHESLTPRCGRVKWRTFLFWFPDDLKKTQLFFFFLIIGLYHISLRRWWKLPATWWGGGTVRMKQAIFPAWGPFLLFLEGAWNKLNWTRNSREERTVLGGGLSKLAFWLQRSTLSFGMTGSWSKVDGCPPKEYPCPKLWNLWTRPYLEKGTM